MKNRLIYILVILIIAMCFIFFSWEKDILELKNSNELSIEGNSCTANRKPTTSRKH